MNSWMLDNRHISMGTENSLMMRLTTMVGNVIVVSTIALMRMFMQRVDGNDS